MVAELSWCPQQPPSHTSCFASALCCPGVNPGLLLRRDVKQENKATDLVNFDRELVQC